MIAEAIKSNNLEGLEALWQGIYYHDRDNPDFERDVYIAVEFVNLKTVQHVIYGYWNYATLNGVEDLHKKKLKTLAARNPDPEVLKYINDSNNYKKKDSDSD